MAIPGSYTIQSIVSIFPVGVVSAVITLAVEISRGCWPGRETMAFSGSVLDILIYRSIWRYPPSFWSQPLNNSTFIS